MPKTVPTLAPGSSETTGERVDRLYTQQEFREARANSSSAGAPDPGFVGAVDATACSEDDLADQEAFDITGRDGASSPVPCAGIGGSAAETVDFSQLEANAAYAMSRAQVAKAVRADVRELLPAGSIGAAPASATACDPLTEILSDFELRLRAVVEGSVRERGTLLEQEYQERVRRAHEEAALEFRRREAAIRTNLQGTYRKKELVLRAHYRKLMALARRIGEQKSQLQQARRQFEEKLVAVNALHQQVEEMRRQLQEHLGSAGEPIVPRSRI